MNTPNASLPPLVNIDKSGTYLLKLIRPKDDRIATRFKWSKKDADGNSFATCALFFLDGNGNCLTNRYSLQWESKRIGLAILVGKLVGKYQAALPATADVETLWKYVEPAFGKSATIEVEATPDGEWEGKPQFKYKFKKIVAHVVPGSTAAFPEAKDIPETDVPF